MTRAITFALLLTLLLAAEAGAAGLLVPRDGSPPIAVQSHRVTAVVTDGLAETTLRQTFVNGNGRPLEAIYLFPLPEGAALTGVAMEVGGTRLEGLLAERKQARRIYDDIVRSRRDPALVEQVGRNLFRLSVFPVMPDEPTVVELTWIEQVPLTHGAFTYRYPLAGGGESETGQDLTISVTFRSSAPLVSVTSDSKDAQVVLKGPGEAFVAVERVKAKLTEDFVATAKVEVDRPMLTVSTFRDADGEGYFLALVTPPPVREERDILPREVTLVLDTSGSMAGNKLDQAKASALWLLDHLRAVDRVNLIRFSSDVELFAPAPVDATPENIAKLRAFVGRLSATGGTSLFAALSAGLATPVGEGRVGTLVLLTDGLPTLGETNPLEFMKLSRTAVDKGQRVFPFGVGTDLDAGLLAGVGRAGRGRAEVFRPEEQLEDRLTGFLYRTSTPVFADVTFDGDGLGLHDVFPRPLPEVYLGEQLAITGRYREGGERAVTVSGLFRGQRASLSTKAGFLAAPGGPEAVAKLHAKMKLAFLEEQLRLRQGLADEAYYAALDRGAYSTADEIVGEIVAVSLAEGVSCAFTSFLVLLPEDRARLDPRDTAAVREALDRVRKSTTPPGEPAKVPADTPPEEGAVARDAMPGDHAETDGDLPFAESLGGDDLASDAPFEGPSTGAAIGVGGGSGGAFGGRGGHRNLRAGGGSAKTESAIDLGLEWLSTHQDEDGKWDADAFMEHDVVEPASDGPGEASGDTGATGVALLAFLGAAETHKHGRYKKTVREGLRYLKTIQDPEGCFGPRDEARFPEGHAMAALAMCEAYALTASPLFKESAQRGVDFILKLRAPDLAWGRGTKPEGCDTEVSTWMLAALRSAKLAGLRVDEAAFAGMRAWLARVTDPDTGRAGTAGRGADRTLPPELAAKYPTARSEAPTAMALIARIFSGEDPQKSEAIAKGTALLMKALPSWDEAAGTVDVDALYFGTLAVFQVGGDAWKVWNEALRGQVLDRQRSEPAASRGSFDPVPPWGHTRGRVYSTALLTMCFEVYYRYARVFGAK
ncbi:MAG: VWA domain-containing protein [Planctomycetes bacterium]|nr:VWA domain-containing protein [Planctomycetota bacterium]